MQEDIKLEVAEAREAPEQHPQWEFEDDEDEEDSKEEESDDEFATDSEADDDDEWSGKLFIIRTAQRNLAFYDLAYNGRQTLQMWSVLKRIYIP